MVCVDALPRAQIHLRRGWRMANRLQADLLAGFLETPGWVRPDPEERRQLEENLREAEVLGAEVVRVQDSDVARALAQIAHEKNVGSVVIGHPRKRRLQELLRPPTVSKVPELAPDVDIHVVVDSEHHS